MTMMMDQLQAGRADWEELVSCFDLCREMRVVREGTLPGVAQQSFGMFRKSRAAQRRRTQSEERMVMSGE